MSERTRKQQDEAAGNAALASSTSENGAVRGNARASGSEVAAEERRDRKDVPRWRQIEIMQERAQLRAALDDFDAEFDELDQLEREVFGSESENESFYLHDDSDEFDEDAELDEDADFDEDEELDEDVLDDGEYEDFEED